MKIVADRNIPYLQEAFGALGDVSTFAGREITPEQVRDADLVIVRSVTRVDERLLGDSSVRFVGTATIGTDHVDVDYLRRAGIGFSNAAGSNANSVAEYVVSALVTIARKYGMDLTEQSIGIIGAGNVGSKVREKARALGMKTVLNDPPLARKTGDPVYRPLSEALDTDIISLHVPLTDLGPDATRNMVDREFLDSTRQGAILINTSRGAVIVERELEIELRTGGITGAVLDVWREEPDINVDLARLADIATPHIAGYSLDGKAEGTQMILQAACQHLNRPVPIEVTKLLPPPDVPELTLNTEKRADTVVRETVRRIYDVRRDDAELREGLELPSGQRGDHFDRLRREYGDRREFHNTTLQIERCPQPARDALIGLGFRLP